MIYEYKCQRCHNYFAIERPITTPIVKGKHTGARCKCGSVNVKKVISYPSIAFKGAGFTLSKEKTGEE